MMIVKATLLFLVAYTAAGENVAIEYGASWPAKYNVEATKLYLTSGLVEHLKYWKSKTISRLDSNNGSVTRIIKPQIKPYGLKYEIHPETTEEEINKQVCYKKNGTSEDTIEDIDFLPITRGFQIVGRDVVKDVICVKLTRDSKIEENGIQLKEKLWISYDHVTKSLVPVRYESQMGNIRHGYLMSHEIYDFFNFNPRVDYKVFTVYKNYECKDTEDEDEGKKTAMDAGRLQYMNTEEKNELDKAFELYKMQFNKKYSHRVEHEKRKIIFHKKWRLVTETNQRNLSYKLVLNKMSDRTKKELERYKGLRRDKPRIAGNIFPYSEEEIKKISETLPPEYDLRLEGVVGPVLDQDDCGSCWTFSTTAAVEGALARSNGGTLVTLSNQAVLDCSWGLVNAGCDGGSDIDAYKWIMKHGLPTAGEYGPYVKEDGYCHIKNMTTTYKIRGWTVVTPLSEKALKIAIIKHGPLSVSIDASDKFLQYDGGIFYDTDCFSSINDLNHMVTLVGYGEKDGESFWIIKNSYGPYWGLDGYMHISTRNNNCGIMTEPTYVVIQ